MASKTLAVAIAAAAALMATGYAFAAEGTSSTTEWKAPQAVGQPGYKEETAKPRAATAPRAIRQDPYAARNPQQSQR
ncbi:hypothetical protein V3H18_10670 [Methylocystis sp. 9N]|uniref:Uncharacterized protein n=1 Tax=Methylocystis borbori TaxID=3118750 RepID=A0ABU7XIX2_9HYPH